MAMASKHVFTHGIIELMFDNDGGGGDGVSLIRCVTFDIPLVEDKNKTDSKGCKNNRTRNGKLKYF